MRLVSPGLTMDLLLGVLADNGFDVSKPHCRSFVSYQQEREIEAELHRRVIGMMNGLTTENSFLDTLSLTSARLYTTDCSSYAPLRDNMFTRDYQLINRVRHDEEGLIIHEPPVNDFYDYEPPILDLHSVDEFNTGTGNILLCQGVAITFLFLQFWIFLL